MQTMAPEAFILLAVCLTFATSSQAPTVISSKLTFPACSCVVNKPIQFVMYMSDNSIRKRLTRWDSNVRDISLSQWGTIASTPSSSNLSFCHSRYTFQKSVDYDVNVSPPPFLQPFVGSIKATQHKTQNLVDCVEKDRFRIREEVSISNLPVISTIHLFLEGSIQSGTSPWANLTVIHEPLPWYMQMVQKNIHDEIVGRAASLWRITVGDLCRCAV